MLKHFDFISSISNSLPAERVVFFSEMLWNNSGKASEVASVYKGYVHSLYDYGMHICSVHGIVMNGLQDVFVRHSRNPEVLSNIRFVKPHLFRTLRGLLIHSIVKHRIQAQRQERDSFELIPIVQPPRDNEGNRIKSIGFSGLHSLSRDQREVIYLKWCHGFNYGEIADITDMPIESIHRLVSKTSELLGKKIQEARYPVPVL